MCPTPSTVASAPAAANPPETEADSFVEFLLRENCLATLNPELRGVVEKHLGLRLVCDRVVTDSDLEKLLESLPGAGGGGDQFMA